MVRLQANTNGQNKPNLARIPAYTVNAAKIMEEVASDNRVHMVAIGKEYQEMANQLIKVSRRESSCNILTISTGSSAT